jgi:hypothetical protein
MKLGMTAALLCGALLVIAAPSSSIAAPKNTVQAARGPYSICHVCDVRGECYSGNCKFGGIRAAAAARRVQKLDKEVLFRMVSDKNKRGRAQPRRVLII